MRFSGCCEKYNEEKEKVQIHCCRSVELLIFTNMVVLVAWLVATCPKAYRSSRARDDIARLTIRLSLTIHLFSHQVQLGKDAGCLTTSSEGTNSLSK
jgi:hypothetical protein